MLTIIRSHQIPPKMQAITLHNTADIHGEMPTQVTRSSSTERESRNSKVCKMGKSPLLHQHPQETKTRRLGVTKGGFDSVCWHAPRLNPKWIYVVSSKSFHGHNGSARGARLQLFCGCLTTSEHPNSDSRGGHISTRVVVWLLTDEADENQQISSEGCILPKLTR